MTKSRNCRREQQYARTCRENRIDYVRLDTRTPFDRALLAYLEKRSKLL